MNVPEIAVFLQDRELRIQPVNAEAQAIMVEHLDAMRLKVQFLYQRWTRQGVLDQEMLVIAAELQDWFRYHLKLDTVVCRAKRWQVMVIQQELVDV